MAKPRKKNDSQRRLLRATEALLRQNHIAIVDLLPQDKQGLINWKTCRAVKSSRQLVNGVCDLPHRWTIYLAVFCRSPLGERYIKGEEIVPAGQYRSEQINPAITHYHEELLASCNQSHVIGTGWIASPVGESLTEDEAARVFEAVGCWESSEAA